ncbi:hypothetical protein MMC07_002129 [Pseudocyphellaria aurata]|nr:hypothetical protein [Pseudocyphellaria aurata]
MSRTVSSDLVAVLDLEMSLQRADRRPPSINSQQFYLTVFGRKVLVTFYQLLIHNPSLCLPQATLSTFNHLPIPVSLALATSFDGQKPDIRAVVLDKDDCFAMPKENAVYKPYHEKFQALRRAYPGSRLLIVSNSAGTNDDVDGREANQLEAATGVKVLRHGTKKPGCGPQILDYFYDAPDSNVTLPSQIAVVGDRLSTDVVMANMMGSWSIWVKDGVIREKSLVRFVASVMGSNPDMNADITMGVQTASLLVPQGFRSFKAFLTHQSYFLSQLRLLSFANPREGMCCSLQIVTLWCIGYDGLAKLVALFKYPTGCDCELQTIACYPISRVHELFEALTVVHSLVTVWFQPTPAVR